MQVAFSTLRDRISNKHKSYKTHVKLLQALKKPEEAMLLNHIAQSGMLTDHQMVRANASDIAGCYLGKNWSCRFKKRNPQVITAKPAKLDPKRAKNLNKTIVNDYFDKWEELNEQYGGIPPEHIWNMDEKGVQMGGGHKNSGKGYFYIHDHHNCYRISSDNLELVTVVECVSAAGESAPTAFVLSDGPLPDLRKLVSDKSFGGYILAYLSQVLITTIQTTNWLIPVDTAHKVHILSIIGWVVGAWK